MDSLSVYYSTPFDVPAPFSYEISIDFEVIMGQFQVDFEMKYSNREDLTPEEIIDEGFSITDDFKWKGAINNAWLNELENLSNKTEPRNSLKDQEIIIKKSNEKFAPKNYKEWNHLIQDLIQAIFETSAVEKPWQMNLQIIKNGNKEIQQMKVLFADREVDFAYGSKVKMDWQKAKMLMELIYLGDFDESKAITQLPDKEGVYLSFDQLTWYKLGHSITSPHGNKGYLSKLEFELAGLQ